MAIDPSQNFKIIAVSANATTLLGQFTAAAELLGLGIAHVISPAFAEKVIARYLGGRLRGTAPWQSTLCPPEVSIDLDAAVHSHAGLVIVEIELSLQREGLEALEASRQLQESLVDLQESEPDIESLARVLACGVRALMGYERVVIYRFDADWHGRAIAEDMVGDWQQSLDGLHFPASDIPAQARALYRVSKKRWVADRDAAPVPLLAEPGAPHRSIDLSFARLRSLSPIHLQYHRNMGVNGSMSLSVLDGNRLWGLVNCHHRQPHHPSPGQRVAATVLTDAFALRVGPAEHADTEHARRTDLARSADLFAHMAGADNVTTSLTTGSVTMADLFSSTGAAVMDGGTITLLGMTPPEPAVRALCHWLSREKNLVKQFHTDHLAAFYPNWEPYASTASGLLAVFLSDDRSDVLLWFRPEEAELISWGGNPNKNLIDGSEIMPRKSFERWVDTRHGIARPWLSWELEIAESLRHGITDVIVRSLRRITDLNERLRQRQKMEVIGELAGGIAHDFNNFLAGVILSLSIVEGNNLEGDPEKNRRYIKLAMDSAKRAAALAQRLLTFSRRQTLAPVQTDVIQRALGMEELIKNAVGPSIQVGVIKSLNLWTTLCDGNQLDSALLNLSINARDAMPDGGSLTIEASNTALAQADPLRFPDTDAGDYVTISVSDTGVGMAADVAARVFEPFFTTKPLGSGTGLGLSMVYGFAKQSNGCAAIYSEPGIGTTVRIYLPRYRASAEDQDDNVEALQHVPAASSSAQTILVVDDNTIIRMSIIETLEDEGFTVIEAATGTEGLRILQSKRRVDLLLTDVGLPGGLNGRQLADAARVELPDLKILFITGYAEQAVLKNGRLEPGMQLITKPFTAAGLIAKVWSMA